MRNTRSRSVTSLWASVSQNPLLKMQSRTDIYDLTVYVTSPAENFLAMMEAFIDQR